MKPWAEQIAVLTGKEERWLLLVGSNLSASSGVPLPFTRTPWSPSIADLVRYHIFRTQSREVSESVQRALGEGKPPLGFIADDLQGQVEWLKTYTDKITPQRAQIRLADLIKGGMFQGIISNAPDDLLERAMDMLGVTSQTLSLEQPHGVTDTLTLLKEWDDLVFQDTNDRRTREAAYIKTQLEAMVAEADGVLFVGCHPYASDLMNNMLQLSQQRPDLKLVWLEESRQERSSAKKDGQTAPAWFAKHHKDFTKIAADDMGDVFDAIAQARGIAPSPIIATPVEAQSGLVGMLNRSFDVKPILVYVPGMALFSGALDRMPKISLKALLSLAMLLLVILGALNYREYQAYNKGLTPARAALQRATAELRPKKPRFQQLITAEKSLDTGRKLLLNTPKPKATLVTLPLLQSHLRHHRKQLLLQIDTLRSERLLPLLVKQRLQRQLSSSSLLRNMGHFPDVSVSAKQREVEDDAALSKEKQGKTDKRRKSKNPFASTQQVRPLTAHEKKQHIALFASSSMLLQVVMNKQMLRELRQGRLVIPIDLDRAGSRPLETVMQQTLQSMAGYGTKPTPRFHPGGLVRLLNQGAATFYFFQLDTSGGVSKNLERINTLLDRFPRCRGVLATYLLTTFQRIGAEAARFTRLEIEKYKQRQARAFLRTNTSHRFFRGVMNNSYLRWNMTRPLVMSLLINYYRWVGQPPRSLGVIYDRLLRTMLQGSRFGLPQQFDALGVLAYHTLSKKQDDLQREQASQLVATRTKLSLVQANALIDELVKRGVLRYPSLTHVRVMDTDFQYLGVARELQRLSFAKRRHFLLRQHPKIISFYAGIQPKLTKLVRAWLDDYKAVDRLLRAKGQARNWVNPHLPALKYAALAVNNGDVDHALVKQLETTLFGLIKHRRYNLIKPTVEWGLTHMSSAGVKQLILRGIEQDSPYDHRLFRLASMSPNDIYVGAIQRWMQRVRTDKDKQAARRPGKTALNPRAQRLLLRRTRTSFGRAISLLVGLGTNDAIQSALSFARRESDPRFSKADWRYIRLFAVYMLMVRGYFYEVAPTLSKLLLRNPQRWQFLVARLYKANNKKAADLLVKLIALPGGLAKATNPKQTKQVRRWLRVKRRAAQALARLDEDLSVPALKAALQRTPKGAEDYRPYIALALGRRGDKAHFKLVKTLVASWKRKTWAATTPAWYRRRLSQTLAKGVALFGTKEALVTLQEMTHDPTWRSSHKLTSRSMDALARYIKHPAARDYYVRRLLCHTKSKRKFEKYRLLLRLASIQTPRARAAINQLLQIKLGRDDQRFSRSSCGAAAKPATLFKAFRSTSSLDDFVWALGRFQEPGDLPRFAQWALHPQRLVRRAALIALGRYKRPEASEALRQSLLAHPQDTTRIIRMMGRQKLATNEPHLLALLQKTLGQRASNKPKQARKHKLRLRRTMSSLGSVGGFRSVLQLYPLQSHPLIAKQAAHAIYRLIRRTKGDSWQQPLLLTAIRSGKVPKIRTAPLPLARAASTRKPRRVSSRRKRLRPKPRRRRVGGFGGFGSTKRRKRSGFGKF